jgi:hypothetical protein
MKTKKLINCICLFEKQEDLEDFWNLISDSNEISNNTFIVMQDNWLRKIIKWLLKAN